MYKYRKLLFLSLLSCIFLCGTFVYFIIINLNTSYKSLPDNHSITTVVVPQQFTSARSKKLFARNIIVQTFKARANNFGTIAIPFNTSHKSVHDRVLFRIRQSDKKNWYYQHIYDARQFQMDVPFTFGFPSIADSNGKIYTFEIESLEGNPQDSLSLSTHNPVFISEYSFPEAQLKNNPSELFELLRIKMSIELSAIIPHWLTLFIASILAPFILYALFLWLPIIIRISIRKLYTLSQILIRLIYNVLNFRPRALGIILNGLLGIIIANLFLPSLSEISYLYPREYRDASLIDIAHQFVIGNNPYTINNSLPHTYLYGFVGPLLNAVISRSFHFDLALTQHLITFICMILLGFIVGKEIWQSTKKVSLVLLSLAVAFLYNNVNLRQEILAILLTTSLLYFVNHYANRKTKLSFKQIILLSLSTIILFYIKQYFLLLFPVLIIYFINNQPKITLIYFIVMNFVIGAASVFLVNKLFPAYFLNTFFNYLPVAGSYWSDWMVQQSLTFFQLNWLLVSFFIVALVMGFIKNMDIHFNIMDINKPLLTISNTPLDSVYFIYSFIAILCLTFKLGNNGGAYLSYYTQLLPIPMAIFCITYLNKRFKQNQFYRAALLGVIILFIIENYTYLRVSTIDHIQERLDWNKALNILSQNDPQNAYLSPTFTIEAIKRGWPISDNGHTEYYGLNAVGLNMPPGERTELAPRLTEWKSEIDYKITHKKFSFIMRPSGGEKQLDTDLMKKNYVIKQRVDVPTLGTTEMWVPK